MVGSGGKKSKKNLHFETVNIFQAVLGTYSMVFLLSHSLSFKRRCRRRRMLKNNILCTKSFHFKMDFDGVVYVCRIIKNT